MLPRVSTCQISRPMRGSDTAMGSVTASRASAVSVAAAGSVINVTGSAPRPATAVTSLVRQRLGQRAWRAVHWFAYLAWPVAFLHSLTAGNDLGVWWVALVEVGSAAAVAAAVLARVFGRSPLVGAHEHR